LGEGRAQDAEKEEINMPLPKELFVTHEEQNQDGGYYTANLSAEAAVSGSEFETPIVGTYRLVEENALELIRTTRIRKVKAEKK
jgi:hypothetical protein